MLKKILEKINRTSESPSGQAPDNINAEFILYYNDLRIGYLKAIDGKWHYSYSEEFKKQHVIKPIIGFSDIDNEYASEELWPFFIIRIPSFQQPKIQEILEQENLDKDNNIQMLKRFGKKTIANPFILEPT